jgi:hypothetical protein
MTVGQSEAWRWLAWLDGDRTDDGTREMVDTPYQAAQRIAARLYRLERLEAELTGRGQSARSDES